MRWIIHNVHIMKMILIWTNFTFYENIPLKSTTSQCLNNYRLWSRWSPHFQKQPHSIHIMGLKMIPNFLEIFANLVKTIFSKFPTFEWENGYKDFQLFQRTPSGLSGAFRSRKSEQNVRHKYYTRRRRCLFWIFQELKLNSDFETYHFKAEFRDQIIF